MQTDVFITACDPGSSGGFAWFEQGVGVVAKGMPDTEEGRLEIVRSIASVAASTPWVVYMEMVTGYIAPRHDPNAPLCPMCKRPQTDGGHPASRMFNFGENYGSIRAMFKALGATVELVPPKTWQSPLFLKRGKGSKEEWKRTLKNAAQRKFPNIKVTLKTADALLILSYATLRNPSGNTSIADRASKRATDASTERETAIVELKHPLTGRYMMKWKGELWVFEDRDTSGTTLIRKASDHDKIHLPTR